MLEWHLISHLKENFSIEGKRVQTAERRFCLKGAEVVEQTGK
jgi:hypothetical protein